VTPSARRITERITDTDHDVDDDDDDDARASRARDFDDARDGAPRE
jgi:hypothetical protein